MARVLHTADVHLQSPDGPRFDALAELLDVAETREVDAVTIGGDLFDDPATVEALRPRLRNDLFTDRPYEIILIPGNHDTQAFRGDIFFGEDCTVRTSEPFSHWESDDESLRITCLPYHDYLSDDLALALAEREPFDGQEALLLHCSLAAPVDSHTGEEDARYFPVGEEFLAELGFEYYLAGHYHRPQKVTLPNDAVFTYPGTPASTTIAETGPRRISLLDTDDGVELLPLESFHYARESFQVRPGDVESVLDQVSEWVAGQPADTAEATVVVEGFVDVPEDEFASDLAAAAGDASVENNTLGVARVRAHPLFEDFEAELEAIENEWEPETVEGVRNRTLAVMADLVAEGEL